MANSGSEKRRRRPKKNILVHLGPDFISDLPDNIIEDILQRLSIRESARTSVLARKWRYKWWARTQVIFDENCMKPSTRKILTQNFANTISCILGQHQGPIHNFKLSVVYCNIADAKQYIHEWLDILSKKGVRNLALVNYIGRSIGVGDSLYACEHLEVLKLRHWSLKVPDSFISFKYLKDLYLQKIKLKSDEFKSLTSRCPLLEKLTVIGIGTHCLEVHCSKLQYLNVQGVFDELRIDNNEHLKFLLIDQSESISLFGNLWPRVKENFTLNTVFASLQSIKSLEVWSHTLQYFAIGGQIPMSLPTILNCVKDISMSINIKDLDQISAAFCLIRSSPNLIRLRIGEWLGPVEYNAVDDVAKFWEDHNKHICCLDHLSTVEMEQSTCAGFGVEFINYIQQNSPSLERITVEVQDRIPDAEVMLFKHNLQNNGGSTLAEVEVTKTTKCVFFN
ncbi:hypothetical protein AQUCO_01000389v1 [Aquilegia coerulea]|uniref:F-box domain-containing protein n=1 Tax=Aquilegia coerulea TaxID=218851 RepID=A0A2G5E9P3_AQUCA|nr:hypothetical protein AQUCO_01000389v1 [Aquilegia coerulea]